jgi:hypothetical protein
MSHVEKVQSVTDTRNIANVIVVSDPKYIGNESEGAILWVCTPS